MNNTLVLTGMMGSGKSSIGKELSNILSSKFYDTDLEIEKMLNMTVPNIFKNKGENYFRKIEEKICIDFLYLLGINDLRTFSKEVWKEWKPMKNIFKFP